ncbi:MAG: alpha/beta hydrolase [bacterium]|nr:alpha/beta hydrolase [bacterium]
MKRAIIIHCWEGFPDYCWYPQTKKELEVAGFKVDIPEMPDTKNPKLSAWVPKLKEVAGAPDGDLYLVGHSIGAAAIMRYLETLKEGERIGGALFVAGFTDDLGYEEVKTFFETPLDFEKIRSRAGHFVAIYSDNDPYVPEKYAKILSEKLGAELVFKPGLKHFSGPEVYEESCTSLPEVAQAIVKMVK